VLNSFRQKNYSKVLTRKKHYASIKNAQAIEEHPSKFLLEKETAFQLPRAQILRIVGHISASFYIHLAKRAF